MVLWDGLDQLEKERAVQFYSGKTWNEVLDHLRNLKNEPIFGAAYYLEEWSVLSKEALPYYLRAHLEFLLETLSSPQTDNEFVAFLLGQLYQVIYMHKGSPFTRAQTLPLRKVAQSASRQTNDRDLELQATRFLGEWMHMTANHAIDSDTWHAPLRAHARARHCER